MTIHTKMEKIVEEVENTINTLDGYEDSEIVTALQSICTTIVSTSTQPHIKEIYAGVLAMTVEHLKLQIDN